MRTCYWPRVIIHVNMYAFFASLERRDFPELGGRAQGHVAVSTTLMQALTDISPDVEVLLGRDEAFIDVTHCQGRYGSPEYLAQMVKHRVDEVTRGLPCSVGVAGDKSTAKVASAMHKPDGLTVIPPWEARARLQAIPLEKICGLSPGINDFLGQYGARTCGDVAAMPMNLLVRRYGMRGKQAWLICQGRDTTPLMEAMAPPKSIGQGKVLPPRTISRRTVLTYVRHMCEKLAARLRHYDMQTSSLYVGLRYARGCDASASARRAHEWARKGAIEKGRRDGGSTGTRCFEVHAGAISSTADGIAEVFVLPYTTADGKGYFGRAQALLEQHWRGEPVTHVQLTATHLRNASGQLELFSPDEGHAIQDFKWAHPQ